MEYGKLFVCLMGMGIVFFGLVCIIVLVSLMGKICQKLVKAPVAAAPEQKVEAVPDRQAVIAAVSAVIAEEMGTDVTGLRILSFKKI